jgi:hypothetical protein
MALENLKPVIQSSVVVTEDQIVIDNFTITNKQIVDLFTNNKDMTADDLLEHLIFLGSETVRIMGTSATTEILENVAHEVKTNIEDLAKKMVAETGELSVKGVLQSWRTEFASLLSDSFDANRTDSIMTKFDVAMKLWAENQQDKVIKELNLNQNGSSLFGLNEKLTSHINTTFESLQKQLQGIATALSIDEATKGLKQKVSSRGNTFEDLVFDAVADLSREYRDTADNPGKTKTIGKDGNDEGDITVDINEAESHGATITFVWECKVRSTKQSDRWLFDELKKGLSNRDAKAGVIVTDAVTALGVNDADGFFRENGNLAILIVDTKEPDTNAIKFAYLWSRWICQRDQKSILDVGTVREVIDSILRDLSVVKSIKGHHSSMANELELVKPKVESLEKNIKIQLEKLSEIIEITESD